MTLVTDIDQLSAAIAHATAPAFVLGAAGCVSVDSYSEARAGRRQEPGAAPLMASLVELTLEIRVYMTNMHLE